jgi:hypothetical protein
MKKTFTVIMFLFGIIGITTYNCKKESSVSNNHKGEPFLIKINETKAITPVISDNNGVDSSLTVNFVKVINDLRCPKASCYLCYGSSAGIQVLLVKKNVTTSVSLTILGCQDEYTCDDQLYYRKDTLGYRICLLRLDPYPDGTTPVNQSGYTAKLNISKL